MKKKLISVIVTNYNEKDSILEMYRRVVRVFAKLPNYSFELLYVDNSSTDGSWLVYSQLAKKDKRVKVIVMSRNFGSPQPSFLAGLAHAQGKASVLLHGDIQDPPELIPAFIHAWEKGFDVVYGVRSSRKGYGLVWNMLYKAFYYILNKLAYITIPPDAGDFSLLDAVVVRELLKLDEYDYYIRCLRAYVGFAQKGVTYVREERKHGISQTNLFMNLWWAKTILVNFSFKPLEWISTIGFTVMVLTFLFMIINLVFIIFERDSPRGIPTIVILVLFLGGVQLLSLSVIAEYLSKIFLEVKRRPKYIIQSSINIKKKEIT